jgi:hypothetical protein
MSNFETRPDSGVLFKNLTKAGAKSPDYQGEIAVDLNNMTAIRVENGITIIKISGWSKEAASGKKYISFAVDRFVKDGSRPAQKARTQRNDDDEF